MFSFFPQQIVHEHLHDRERTLIRGIVALPMQRPRDLDQICFTLHAVQVELLGIGERDCGRLVTYYGGFTHIDVPTAK